MNDPIRYCPVCGHGPFAQAYAGPAEIRQSCDICECCGCEYGYDDNEAYFAHWVERGCPWFDQGQRPQGWSLAAQLPHRIQPWPPKG